MSIDFNKLAAVSIHALEKQISCVDDAPLGALNTPKSSSGAI